MENILQYYDAIVTIWAAITTIVALTPTDKDDRIVGRINNLVRTIKLFRR